MEEGRPLSKSEIVHHRCEERHYEEVVNVAYMFPTQRSLRQSEKEDREEAEHDAQEHDLARRYVFGSPFHKDEIASPDHSEQGKSKVSGFLHSVIRLLCVSA
jgi:hypothetical protein